MQRPLQEDLVMLPSRALRNIGIPERVTKWCDWDILF